jgi:hypothetical protein
MDMPTLHWLLQNATVVLFIGLAGGMANWRTNPKHQATVRAVRRDVIDAARRRANLQQSDMASAVEMDEGHFSRALDTGGNLTALAIIGIEHPVFGAALVARLGELLRGASESPEARLERVERLIRDLHNRLPQMEPVKCEEVRQRDSSAA